MLSGNLGAYLLLNKMGPLIAELRANLHIVCSDSAPLQPHNKVPLEKTEDEGRIKGMELSD